MPAAGASIDDAVRPLLPLLKKMSACRSEDASPQGDAAAADGQEVGGGQAQFVEAGGLGVADRGSIDDRFDACPMQGGHTHRARLAGCGHQASVEMDLSGGAAGCSECVDLCVGRDVGRSDHRVMCHRKDLVVPRNGAAKRALAGGDPCFRRVDGQLHQFDGVDHESANLPDKSVKIARITSRYSRASGTDMTSGGLIRMTLPDSGPSK